MRLLFIIAGSTIGLALPAFAQEQNSAFLLPLGKGFTRDVRESRSRSLWAVFRNRIRFTNIMGAYKGRVNLRHRKRRLMKEQRIKALAAAKKGGTPPLGAAQQGTV
jgi:hypothetical protein